MASENDKANDVNLTDQGQRDGLERSKSIVSYRSMQIITVRARGLNFSFVTRDRYHARPVIRKSISRPGLRFAAIDIHNPSLIFGGFDGGQVGSLRSFQSSRCDLTVRIALAKF
jgi:hypothetical protein